MGHWEFEIPRLKTVTANGSNYDRGSTMTPESPVGWQVGAADKNARCSSYAPPNPVTYDQGIVEFTLDQWWFGYQLIDEKGDEQKLIKRSSSLPNSQHQIGTANNWIIDCLPSTANGEPGEGFLATSPDGTKYWFDYLVYTPFDGLAVTFKDMPPKGYSLSYTLNRRMASMLVTRIEDRFGNSLTYSYNAGKLAAIDASDGRHLEVAGGDSVTGVTVGTGSAARTWSYVYADSAQTSLTEVVLPDLSRWSYRGNFGREWFSNYQFSGCDQDLPYAITGERTAEVTTPAGATAFYTLQRKVFGRSVVPKNCLEADMFAGYPGYPQNPRLYISHAITSRSISGPGTSAQSWTYSYSSPNQSWEEQCASGCVDTVWSEVVNPLGEKTRSYFSNRFDQTENKLVKEETYSAAGTLLRSTQQSYATAPANGANPYPWPLIIGDTFEYSGNPLLSTRWTPLSSISISEGGASYVRTNTEFDAWARPTRAVKGSSLGFSKTEETAYADNTSTWVLGQVAQQAVDGIVASATTYDAATALPVTVSEFGKLKQTLAYNPDGTVATVKDGNNNTTTLSSWKRGLPQSISYADGTVQSAVVDDHGWISSVTDENGFVTSYTYDAMGRLASITYPSGDSAAWNTTTQVFEPVNAAEYGIAAGHWRQTVTTGNGKKLTYYDALWRPLITREYDAGNEAATQRFQRLAYDHDGRVTFASYPGSSDALTTGTWTEYDALGRATAVSQDSELGPLTTLTEYLAGFQTRVTDRAAADHHRLHGLRPALHRLAGGDQPAGRGRHRDRARPLRQAGHDHPAQHRRQPMAEPPLRLPQ